MYPILLGSQDRTRVEHLRYASQTLLSRGTQHPSKLQSELMCVPCGAPEAPKLTQINLSFCLLNLSFWAQANRASPAKSSISYTHAITIHYQRLHSLQDILLTITSTIDTIEIIANHILCIYHIADLYLPSGGVSYCDRSSTESSLL